MRIWVFSHYFPPEGNAPASRIHEMARRWVAAGHAVTVITGPPSVPDGVIYAGYRNHFTREVVDGIDVVRVRTYVAANKGFLRRSLNFASYMVSASLRALGLRRPDVIVATTPQFFCGWAGVIAARMRRRDPSDPLLAKDAALAELIEALAPLPQLRRLRVHTRLPITIPSRITPRLVELLGAAPWPTIVVFHVNHARELDAEVDAALARLRRAGVTLLNQSVLLRGVNDDAGALIELSERLFAAGVLPYYLHLLDRVAGAAHFEVDEDRARTLLAALHRALPGFLIPRLVREVPGEASKLPVDLRLGSA